MAVAQWIDLSTMPWISGGSGGGPSPGVTQAFMAGMQAKQNEQDRELRMRELDMRAEQQDMLGLLRREKLNADLVAQEGVAALATVMGEAARSGYDEQSEARLYETAGRFPALMTRPEFKEFTQQFELSRSAKLRRELLTDTITGRTDLENLKFEHREALMDEKYDRLATLQEDSQEARTLRDEIMHEYNLERDAKRPSPSGQKRFDMPYSVQLKYKARLDAVNKDLFMDPTERQRQIEAIYREMRKEIDAPKTPAAPESGPQEFDFDGTKFVPRKPK